MADKEYTVFLCETAHELQTSLATAGGNDWDVVSIVPVGSGVWLTLSRDDVAAKLSKNALEGLVERLDRYAVHRAECPRAAAPMATCTCGLQEIRRDVELVAVPF